MPKISQLPQQSSPTTSDKVPVVSGGTTDYETLSDLITFFFNNIPAGAHSDVTRANENSFPYVVGGTTAGGAPTGVWSADSAGVNRNASMTAATVYINGRRISIGAVTARTFTASKDTYIDVLDNLDGTGTLVYTEVTNNNTSPVLASNSMRMGIIVTGATTIAAAASINQGQEDRILPIVSSVPYAVTDSLGNLICCRDPNTSTLGLRQIVSTFAPGTTAETLITGLNTPVKIPLGRKIEVMFYSLSVAGSTALTTVNIYEGVFGSGGTKKQQCNLISFGAAVNTAMFEPLEYTPTSSSLTYTATVQSTAGNPSVSGAAASPGQLVIRLV